MSQAKQTASAVTSAREPLGKWMFMKGAVGQACIPLAWQVGGRH